MTWLLQESCKTQLSSGFKVHVEKVGGKHWDSIMCYFKGPERIVVAIF